MADEDNKQTPDDSADSYTETLTPDEALARAIELHQKGRATEAQVIYNAILKKNPAHSGALHFLGILFFQHDKPTEAIELINLALTHAPGYTDARNNLGNIYQSQGMFSEAEACYRETLKSSPEHADATNNLAAVLKAQGHYEAAVACYQSAVALSPDNADFHYNLGNAHSSCQQWQLAETAYREAITIDAKYVAAYRELGSVLRTQGRQDEAVEMLSTASELNATHAETHNAYGVALHTSGLFEDAVTAYLKAIHHDPDFTPTYGNLVVALCSLKRTDEAREVVRKWLDIQPNSPVAQHIVASITGDDVPERASDGYVKGVFDTFSATFDEKLQALEYRAPQLIVEKLKSDGFLRDTRAVRVLDAGCGTGLCGPLLRDYASVLDGVDLSSGMLSGARKLNVYDDLIERELTAFLQRESGEYDLIISADTLVYFGQLDDFMRASHDRLTPRGCLAFSVEKLEVTPTMPYRLNLHGRYSHSRDYLTQTLQQHGFDEISLAEETLRKEMGKPVDGFVVTARRT